ncbi:glucosyl transferase [Calothrix sp. HK-06]|nr:glucosyl transferase [Calothrix sp. HK-06]
MTNIVTVVIPAYNASEYLAETITSVLQQTFANFEIIVVDDGSKDNTMDIVHSFSQQDSRVKLISQKNQGVSVARNTGIKNAQGEFIAFLDADDVWLPQKLALHVQHLSDNPSLGMSFGRVEFMNSDGRLTGQRSNPRLKDITPQHLYQENPAVTPSNAVIRRRVLEQIGGFDLDLSGFADVELFLRVSCKGCQVEGLDEVLVLYRTSTGGMSSQLHRMEEEWNCLNRKVQYYAPEIVKKHYNQAKAMLLRYLARRALRLSISTKVGVNYMNRALLSEWTLILREPRRTLLTMIAVYGKYLMPKLKGSNS